MGMIDINVNIEVTTAAPAPAETTQAGEILKDTGGGGKIGRLNEIFQRGFLGQIVFNTTP